MILVLVSILLIIGSLAGCRPAAPRTSVDDSGAAFEAFELFTTNGMILRSRPLDWRSAGGKDGTAWRTLDADDTINPDLSRSVECHGGYAYFARSDRRTIRRAPQTGTVETVFTNDEPMLDWRVSLGGKYVAVYREDGTHIDIWSLSPRTLVQTIEAQKGAVGEPGNPSFDQFGTWSFLKENGKGVSTFTAAVVPDAPAGHVVSLLQTHIDENGIPSVEVRHIAETAQNMFSWRDYVFDPQDEIIACDSYPFIVDVDSARAFSETGTVTRLYVYSLRDDKSYAVDERSTCRFLPRWVGPGALEFNITPTTGTEASGPFKGSYIVRHDILSLIETGSPALTDDQLFVKRFITALIDEHYTDAAACFAFPIREKELRAYRAVIIAGADPKTLTEFKVEKAYVFSQVQSPEVFVDAQGFRITEKEALAAIIPVAKKSPEYAAIIKQYGAAMKRLDEMGDQNRLDPKTLGYAQAGRTELIALYRQMAPKYVIPVVQEIREIHVSFASQEFGPDGMPATANVIPTESGYRLIGFAVGDIQKE
jgi:hypothetical protein